MAFSEEDLKCMKMALEEAQLSLEKGNYPVGGFL